MSKMSTDITKTYQRRQDEKKGILSLSVIVYFLPHPLAKA
jgi:hypothetical protein